MTTDSTIYAGRIARRRVANATKPFTATYQRRNGGGTRQGSRNFATAQAAFEYLLNFGLTLNTIELLRIYDEIKN